MCNFYDEIYLGKQKGLSEIKILSADFLKADKLPAVCIEVKYRAAEAAS